MVQLIIVDNIIHLPEHNVGDVISVYDDKNVIPESIQKQVDQGDLRIIRVDDSVQGIDDKTRIALPIFKKFWYDSSSGEWKEVKAMPASLVRYVGTEFLHNISLVSANNDAANKAVEQWQLRP